MDAGKRNHQFAPIRHKLLHKLDIVCLLLLRSVQGRCTGNPPLLDTLFTLQNAQDI